MSKVLAQLVCKSGLVFATRSRASSYFVCKTKNINKTASSLDLSRVLARTNVTVPANPISHSLQVRYISCSLNRRFDKPELKTQNSQVQKIDETFRRIQWFYKLPNQRRMNSVQDLLLDIEELIKSPIFSQFKAFIYQPLMAICVGCGDELENGFDNPVWRRFEKNMQETDDAKQFVVEVRALSEEVKKDREKKNSPSDPINFDNLKLHPHVRAHFHRGMFYFTGEPVHLSRMVQAYHLAAIGTEDRDECVKYMQDCSVALSTIMIYNPQTVQIFMHIGKSTELEQTLAPMIFDIVGRLDAQFSKSNTNNTDNKQ